MDAHPSRRLLRIFLFWVVLGALAVLGGPGSLGGTNPIADKLTGEDVRNDLERDRNDGSLDMGARRQALPPKHQRAAWWPFDQGPRYFVAGPEGDDRTLIHTRAGNFRLDARVSMQLPQELHAAPGLVVGTGGDGENGEPHAYLIALPSEATYRAGSIRVQVEALGVELVDFLPREAVILRARPQQIPDLRSSPLFDHVEAFHPAFKIEPTLGRVPFWNRERAESETFRLRLIGHRGEDPDRLSRLVERAGGSVLHTVSIGERTYLEVDVHRTRVFSLARIVAVASLEEVREYRTLNTTGPATLQTGRYNHGRVPFFDVGVDGGGDTRCVGPGANGLLDTVAAGGDRVSGNGRWILGGSDNDCDTMSVGATDDVLFSLGTDLVPPQLVCVADNGASLDAAGLSHSLTDPCLGGDCPDNPATSMGAGVGPEHRKVQAYFTGDAGGDLTSSGDLTNCDSPASGGGSHGNQVANIILGNPSRGLEGLGITRDDDDKSSSNQFDERRLPLDGEARGARLIFQDISLTTTGSATPCRRLSSGTDVGATFIDQNQLVPGSIAQRLLDCGAARIINFPFGVPGFDNIQDLDNDTGHYLAGAVEIDDYLWNHRDVSVFLPTGNDGADPYSGDAIYPDDPGHPACSGGSPHPTCPFSLSPTRLQVNHLATAKNAVTVGSSRADSLDFFANFDQTENDSNFTSRGPATIESQRIAPLVMGQGSDLNVGTGAKLLFDPLFNSDVVLKSSDNDNHGPVEGIIDESIQGTSFASAHIAGAGALVRDYFAQGFYPRGKALVEDRIPIISGSLTRALLTASGNFLTAFILDPDRFNNEQGVGRVELSNVFPLVSFHGGPVPDDPRRALRPAGSAPDTFPTIPTSLLVFDEFFEGGQTLAKNGAALATGVAVLEEGVTTLTAAFHIMETNEQLRVSLSWYDPASPLDGSGSLINDLDLELESPSGLIYPGNNFAGEFSVDTSQGDTQVDTRNPVELVILDRPVETGLWLVRVKTSDPGVQGAPDAPCVVGGNSPAGPGDAAGTLADGTPVIHSGADGVCNTTATGGDAQLVGPGLAPLPFALALAGGILDPDESTVRLDSGRYDCSGGLEFTILETSAGVSADAVREALSFRVRRGTLTVDLESGGTLPFILQQEGGTFFNREPVVIQASSSPVEGNGVLDVQSGDVIEVEYLDSLPPGPRTATALVDCEAKIDMAVFGTTGPNQPYIVAGGCDVPFGGTFAQGDAHLDAGENIIYQVGFMNSSADRITGVTATLTCIDPDPADAVDPCQVISPLPQTVVIGDMPNGINVPGGVSATGVAFPIRIAPDLTDRIPDSSDRVVKLRTTLGSLNTDLQMDAITFTFSHALHADDARLHYSTDFPQGTRACSHGSNDGTPCNTQAECTGGGSCMSYSIAIDLNRDGKIDRQPVGREIIAYEPISYDTTTGNLDRNRVSGDVVIVSGLLGNPQILDADGPDDKFGRQCFQGSTSVGPACAMDTDCDAGESCQSDDPIPWHMDGIASSGLGLSHHDAGVTGQWASMQDPRSNPGTSSPTEVWGNGGAGACGFQTQDRAAGLFRRAGVWHAGNATDSPDLSDCPDYTAPYDASTIQGVEFLKWALISPVVQKVNTGTDERGFDFTVSMERTAWNENVLLFDAGVYILTSLDNDVRLAANVDPEQDPYQKDDFVALFGSDEYVNTLVHGPVLNVIQNQKRFGGARDIAGGFPQSRMDPDGSLSVPPPIVPFLDGDEVGVARTLGGPRTQQVTNVDSATELSDPVILASLPHPVTDAIPGGALDAADDWINLVTGEILCGPNRRSDTVASGTDLQVIPRGIPCAGVLSVAVSAPDGMLSQGTLMAAQQSNDAGPVRNNEQDQTGYEDSFGASTDRFQYAFQWLVLEHAPGVAGGHDEPLVWEQ